MLTRKQRDLLLFIHERLQENGVAPSFDEMKDALNLKSKSGIHRLIGALEERQFIRRLPNRARALEILRLPDSEEHTAQDNLFDFLHSNDSPRKKALSIALGVFIGLSPLWGFHTIIVIFLAILFKWNKVIAFAFSNISLPPFIPFVLYASSKVGQFITGQHLTYTMEEMTKNFEVLEHLEIYIIGSLALSTSSALVLGLLAYVFLSVFEKKKIAVNNG